jgi:hypothetical protein
MVSVEISLRHRIVRAETLCGYGSAGTGFDIYVHDSYRMVSAGIGIFWFLTGIASVWFLTLVSRKLFGARNRPS